MAYLIKEVSTCPEGAVIDTRYYLAEDEKEMDKILNLDLGGYTFVSCLGPITKPSYHTSRMLNK